MSAVTLYMREDCSDCRAVLMTARALGVALEIHLFDQEVDETRKKEFYQVNPMRSFPTITDNGFHLWESRAIMRYLADKYDKDHTMYPQNLKERATVDQLLSYEHNVYNKITPWLYPKIPPSFRNRSEQTRDFEFKLILDQLESIVLANSEFVTGSNVTIADISLIASISLLEELNFDISRWPRVCCWVTSCKKLPYYEESQSGL